jgi:hypothetical protein
MFGILLSNVIAASSGAELPGLGPFPILQLFGGMISLIAVGLAALVYRKAPNSIAPPPAGAASPQSPPSTEIYLGGPYDAILDRLAAIAVTLERLAGMQYTQREHLAEALRVTRHDLKGAMQAAVGSAETDAVEIKDLLRDAAGVLSRLDEFVRARL